MPSPDPKPLGKKNAGSAIVFDPVAQRITTKKVNTLGDLRPIKTAPKWFNHVEIYDQSELKRLIAVLNLGTLGWTANLKRLCGKCNDIYMMKLPEFDESTAPTAASA